MESLKLRTTNLYDFSYRYPLLAPSPTPPGPPARLLIKSTGQTRFTALNESSRRPSATTRSRSDLIASPQSNGAPPLRRKYSTPMTRLSSRRPSTLFLFSLPTRLRLRGDPFLPRPHPNSFGRVVSKLEGEKQIEPVEKGEYEQVVSGPPAMKGE